LASSLEFRIVIIITITGLQNVQPNFYIFFAFSCIIKLNFEELNTDIIRTQCTVFDKITKLSNICTKYNAQYANTNHHCNMQISLDTRSAYERIQNIDIDITAKKILKRFITLTW